MAKHTFKDNSSRGGLDSWASNWKAVLSFQILFLWPTAFDFWKAGETGKNWEIWWQENSSLQMNAAEGHRNFISSVKHSDLTLCDKPLLLMKFLTKSDCSSVSNREEFTLESWREGCERRMCILGPSLGNGRWSAYAASSAADVSRSLDWEFLLLHEQ